MKFEEFVRKPTKIHAKQVKTPSEINELKEQMKKNGFDVEVSLNDWIIIDEFKDCSVISDEVFNALYTKE